MEIDAARFWSGVSRVRSAWLAGRSQKDSFWFGMSSVCIFLGKVTQADDEVLPRAAQLHDFLFSMMLTNTLLVLTESKCVLLSGAKKIKMLGVVVGKGGDTEANVPLELHACAKGTLEEPLAAAAKAAKDSFDGIGKCGTFTSDPVEKDSMGEQWADQLSKAGVEPVDVDVCMQSVYMVKSAAELASEVTACALASRAMKKVFVKKMEKCFEDDAEMSNATMAGFVAAALEAPKSMKMKGIDADDVEVLVAPQVQSGGHYDTDLATPSPAQRLSSDVLVCRIPVKYRDSNVFVARTFFVDPTPEQTQAYEMVVRAHALCVRLLVPGAVLGNVYDAVVALVASEGDGKMKPYLREDIGCGVGSELQHLAYRVAHGNSRKVEANMSFVVNVCLDGIPLSEKAQAKVPTLAKAGGAYSLALANTVMVRTVGVQVLTEQPKYAAVDITYNLKDGESDSDEEEDEDEEEEDAGEKARLEGIYSNNTRTRVTRSKTKTPEQLEQEKDLLSKALRVQAAQEKLMMDKARKALGGKGSGSGGGSGGGVDGENGNESGEEEVIAAYENASMYPSDLRRHKLSCDKPNETVLVPVAGHHLPFHISTIKSVVKTDEERATVLRFSFFYPTSNFSFARDVPQSMRTVMTKYPQLNYVKEMSYRSKEAHNVNTQYRMIKEMQKRVRQRQKQEEQEADLVDQVELKVLRDPKMRPPTLDDVTMKPPMRKGKCNGRLQAHQNGLRFRSTQNETFDIIYANVKHFIFQECKNELTVLVHFNLKHPVMAGRTKTHDVQFYTEVVEASAALEGNRRNVHDPDEEEEERREQDYKKRVNKMYRKWCSQVCEVAKAHGQHLGPDENDFDVPFRKLAFSGVPNKEMVNITPTVHCLVNLSAFPFFLVTLDDVEHIHFERITAHTKNFDMVIILKNEMTPNSSVPRRITSIPVDCVDMIRNWLCENGEITFTAGTSALQWKNVMEMVYQELEREIFWKNKDEDGVKKDVGWNFLKMEADDDDEAAGAAGGATGAGGKGEDGESESDFDEDDAASDSADEDNWDADVASDDDDDDDDDEAASADEEAEDWDELEKKAAAEDQKKNKRDIERGEEDFSDKKRRKKSGSSKNRR